MRLAEKIRRSLMFLAAMTLASCGGDEREPDRVDVPDQSCRLPADLSQYEDRQFFCIGGELLAVRVKTTREDPLPGAFLSGDYGQVEYRDPRHPERPIFADDHIMLTFRRLSESAPPGEPAFHMISIQGLLPETWEWAAESGGNWRNTPSADHMRCDPDLYGKRDERLTMCAHDVFTDRFRIRYWWDGVQVDPDDWEALDASMRTYLSGLIVEQPREPAAAPVRGPADGVQ